MSVFQISAPAHLSIFVTHPISGMPVSGLPLYAEVAAPRIIPPPPLDEHFREPLRAALIEEEPDIDVAARDRIEAAVLQAIAANLDPASLAHLSNDGNLVKELAHQVFRRLHEMANQGRLADIPLAELEGLVKEALRRAAEELGLGLQPEAEATGVIWAEPLGVLVTDHVGYASFDLKRLRTEVQWLLTEAIEARRQDANAATNLSIWIYPYGYPGKFDAFSQARFAYDAVVARLALNGLAEPMNLSNMGPRSLQNPSLTDWRLSPASFAATPKSLVGEDGCEQLVPSNVALKEFVLRQVVRVDKPPAGLNLHSSYKFAYVDDYKVSWFSLGHSLGEILYSLPLAPAESVKLAVIDWSWDSLTKRDETTKLTEDVLHQTHRDRTITETVKAAIQEYQHGSSFMGGKASSVGGSGGANLGVVGLGAAAGSAWSLGGSTASSDGSRELAAENVQRLSDSFSQASSAQRELNSTVVIQARQEEQESIQTRTFTNYNHSHTLTILYYEVLRHFRITVEWVRRRPAVLAKIPTRIDQFDTAALIGHRHVLEAALLDPSLKSGFDVLEKQEMIREFQAANKIDPNKQPGPPFWEGDLEFTMFELGIKLTDNEADELPDPLVVYVITAEHGIAEKRLELHYVYKGGHMNEDDNAIHNLNSGGRFNEDSSGYGTFVKPRDHNTGQYVGVKWKEISGFQFEKWGDNAMRISFLSIMAFGKEGVVVHLTAPEGWRDVDLHLIPNEPGSQSFTWFNRPGARPALPPPILSPEQSLTQEEIHQIKKLTNHFERYKDYYNRAILLGSDPTSIAIAFENAPWSNNGHLEDHADPTPLEVFGSYVAYPMAKQGAQTDDTLAVDLAAALNGNDPNRRAWAQDKLDNMDGGERQEMLGLIALASVKSERLITLPTRGVFAEGKLGHCNVSEEIDNTRFWKWEEHPIPFEAPGINPVTPITPSPQAVEAAPTAFPQSLVNIVNPSPAPDPTGLGAALSLLGTPNIFRDMSGRQEVADLLKKLSDNTIAIAEAANRAREIQAKYGSDLDKNQKDLELGQTQAGAEVARAALQQRREEIQQVKPAEAQDAIKLSESEVRKGNKTPEQHKEYSNTVQANVKGAQPKKKPKSNLTLQINLEGYGGRRLVGRFGVTVKQHGIDVGFLMATDFSDLGYLKVGVLNDYDDNRYDVIVEGEVLGGVGINAMLKGGSTVVIPRADFDLYDYFYLKAVAQYEVFEYETTKSDEITKEVASRIGGSLEGSYKQIISMAVEGGGEWKDGQSHTVEHAVKVKVAYYTGGFVVAYNKGD